MVSRWGTRDTIFPTKSNQIQLYLKKLNRFDSKSVLTLKRALEIRFFHPLASSTPSVRSGSSSLRIFTSSLFVGDQLRDKENTPPHAERTGYENQGTRHNPDKSRGDNN